MDNTLDNDMYILDNTFNAENPDNENENSSVADQTIAACPAARNLKAKRDARIQRENVVQRRCNS